MDCFAANAQRFSSSIDDENRLACLTTSLNISIAASCLPRRSRMQPYRLRASSPTKIGTSSRYTVIAASFWPWPSNTLASSSRVSSGRNFGASVLRRSMVDAAFFKSLASTAAFARPKRMPPSDACGPARQLFIQPHGLHVHLVPHAFRSKRELVVNAAADFQLLRALLKVCVRLQSTRKGVRSFIRAAMLTRAGKHFNEVVNGTAGYRESHDDEDPPIRASCLQRVICKAELDYQDDCANDRHIPLPRTYFRRLPGAMRSNSK